MSLITTPYLSQQMINTERLFALAANLPKGIKENAEALLERMSAVIEGIGDEPITWKPPILRLVQGTTDRTSIPKGTAIGDFVLGETKIDRPFKLIPLMLWTGRQYWSPDQNESKMLCSSPDAKLGYIGNNCNEKSCPHAKWDEETNRSECGRVKHALCISHDLKELFAVNFAKTNYATGMDFESLLKKAGVSPYRRIYDLDSTTNSKNKNVENFSIKPSDHKDVPAEYLEFLGELFNLIKADRKESLDQFYIMVNERKERMPQLSNSNSSEGTVSLSAPVEGEGTSDAVVSDMSKNYVV
ncbi:MAG TPA: hypothetical protein VFM18_07695 [Methanosarcina sp.]|nr:hypothetical protein [Methanosarcina sp.]